MGRTCARCAALRDYRPAAQALAQAGAAGALIVGDEREAVANLLVWLPEARGWALSKSKNTEYIDLLKKNGMTIVSPPPPQLAADMKKVGETMLKEWLDKAGPEGQAVIDAYKKM